MLKRITRGLEFSEENLALDVIAGVGPGGTFMTHKHTVKWMKTSGLLTKIADRNTREIWAAKGALDSQARAMQRVHEILSHDNPAVFPPEVEARIRAAFPGLVAGNSTLPNGL